MVTFFIFLHAIIQLFLVFKNIIKQIKLEKIESNKNIFIITLRV